MDETLLIIRFTGNAVKTKIKMYFEAHVDGYGSKFVNVSKSSKKKSVHERKLSKEVR